MSKLLIISIYNQYKKLLRCFMFSLYEVWGVFYLYSCFPFGLATLQVFGGTWGWWLLSRGREGLGLRLCSADSGLDQFLR